MKKKKKAARVSHKSGMDVKGQTQGLVVRLNERLPKRKIRGSEDIKLV